MGPVFHLSLHLSVYLGRRTPHSIGTSLFHFLHFSVYGLQHRHFQSYNLFPLLPKLQTRTAKNADRKNKEGEEVFTTILPFARKQAFTTKPTYRQHQRVSVEEKTLQDQRCMKIKGYHKKATKNYLKKLKTKRYF